MRPEQTDFTDVIIASLLDYERRMNVLMRSLEALIRTLAHMQGIGDAEFDAALSDAALLG